MQFLALWMFFKHWDQTQSYVHWRQAPPSELHHQCLKQVILSFYFVSEPTPSLGKTKHMDSSTQFLHQWIWRGRGHWLVLLPNSYLIQTLLARDHSLRTWSHRHTRGCEEHTGGPRNTNVTWKTKAQHTGHSMIHPLFFRLLAMIPIKDKV